MKRFVLIWWSILLSMFGCARGERGSGKIVTETRSAGEFSEVEVDTGLEVEVAIGATAPIEVRGDDNLIGRVITEVSGGRLSIRVKSGRGDSVAPSQKIHIHAVTPKLTKLSVSTGASLTASGLEGEELTLRASSGGTLHASGRADRLTVEATTGAHIEADELEAGEVDARAATGGNATVNAHTAIRGSTSAGGELIVKGKPQKREVETSSGGHVEYE